MLLGIVAETYLHCWRPGPLLLKCSFITQIACRIIISKCFLKFAAPTILPPGAQPHFLAPLNTSLGSGGHEI